MSTKHATRCASIDDASSIARIQVAAWRAAYAQDMPREYLERMNAEDRAQRWRKALSDGNRRILVSIDETGVPAGFCVFGSYRGAAADAGLGELIALNVLPSAWRKGHGRELCQSVLGHARETGWDRLYLWVLKGNSRALAFYERQGFHPDGTERRDAQLTGFELHELRYAIQVGGSESAR